MAGQLYLRVLWRAKYLLLLGGIVGGAVGFAIVSSQTKEYTASSKLFVSARTGDNAADLVQGANFAQTRVQSYADVINSDLVLAPVAAQLGLQDGVAALRDKVTAEVPTDTAVLAVTVTYSDPVMAARIANSVSKSFTKIAPSFEPDTGAGGAPVRVTTVQFARPPSHPSAPKRKLGIALGVIAGLLLVYLAVALRQLVDRRIRSTETLAAVSPYPLLAVLPKDRGISRRPVPIRDAPHTRLAEAFRILRTNLRFIEVDNESRCLVVTSAIPGEGKSVVAANLALALGQGNFSTILVDADLRRPRAATYLGVSGSRGLTSVLTRNCSLDEAIETTGGVHLLAAGPLPPNPSELIASKAMGQLLVELRDRYDYVVLDCPPILAVTDAPLLSTAADGVVLVVGSSMVRTEQFQRSVELLAAVHARVVGTVLTSADAAGTEGAQYYRIRPEVDKQPEDASNASDAPEPAPDVISQ